MNDFEKYIEKRKKSSPEFADNFEADYNDFIIGLILKQARVEAEKKESG